MGKKGKGLQGTCTEDPWTKPKGVGLRVGGRGGWGREKGWYENGDNCTSTTIIIYIYMYIHIYTCIYIYIYI